MSRQGVRPPADTSCLRWQTGTQVHQRKHGRSRSELGVPSQHCTHITNFTVEICEHGQGQWLCERESNT